MSRRLLALSAVALALSAPTGEARAQVFLVPTGTSMIQEDWTAVIANGDPANDGPQIQIYMSPVGDTSLPYVWFTLNSRNSPYAAGGMQVQVWDYTDNLLGSYTNGTAKLGTPNETVTWTQQLVATQQSPCSLIFGVMNGTSTTWGAFGNNGGTGSGQLWAITYATGQVSGSSLTTYNPSVSVSKSRVGWQPNNVTKLGITAVRCLDKNGKVLKTDTTWRPVNLAVQ